jgi:Papain-like cysteine protease AvrRpt2
MDLHGHLVVDGSAPEFSGFRVIASFLEVVTPAKDDTPATLTPATRSAAVASDGTFVVVVPEKEQRSGPITLKAIRPDGLLAGSTELPAGTGGRDVALKVTLGAPTTVETSSDPALGAQLKYTGRVIDTAGHPAEPELIVVIWATLAGAQKAAPVSVATTSAGGYFAGPWRSERFDSAFAVVSGGAPVPIPLQEDRLPFRIIVVVPTLPSPKPKPADCECKETPPRAPSAIDLAENPEAFAADTGHCVDFTVPNRAVEEVVYQAVVRTTQPELNPPHPPRPLPLPPTLVSHLAALANTRPEVFTVREDPPPQLPPSRGTFTTTAAATTFLPRVAKGVVNPAFEKAAALTPGLDLNALFQGGGEAPARDVIADVLEARAQSKQPLQLEASVLTELARESRDLTPLRLLQAEHTSIVRRFRDDVGRISETGAGRFVLGESRQLDWEDIPDRYQATTIAHGHLLSIKQVWRADGYSYGDLLYSLPLAPGQQKLVSVLDWTSEEVDQRRAARDERESLSAALSRDRDISDIVRSSLTEHLDARSHADVESVGGALGGFIGPFVFGAAGGVSSAGSTASQTSGRSVAGMALNRVRDRTQQASSAVRAQRSTVVQAGRQGESVRAQTDAVANNNHCHALTIEYFEVLRHLQVTQELVQVRECLFIPFKITAFNADKALRWREPLSQRLRIPRLRWAFDAIDRQQRNWENSNFPPARYADAQITYLDAEFWMRVTLPRPADDEDGKFVAANWALYESEDLLGPNNGQTTFDRNLGGLPVAERDAAWEGRVAPAIAQRLLEKLNLRLLRQGGAAVVPSLSVDPTLVSRFRNNVPLLVSMRVKAPLPVVTRADVGLVELRFDGVTALPAGAELLVESATMRYRTNFASGFLFENRRVLNDLSLRDSGEDTVQIATPLSVAEKSNPRQKDRRYAEKLIEHLNNNVEFYTRVVLLAQHPSRLNLLLDGLIAPDAGGRSVASVVENRIIGIVGNCLVMPVALGQKLDTTYQFADATLDDLRNLYAVDAAPPMRISIPTAGVFAEAVMGRCNSCEVIDDTRFWRWEESPIPDKPTAIGALSTASRRQPPPSLAPDAFPEPLVRLQTAPRAPDPTGLAAAVQALGMGNIFRDLTGVALNQANAAQALKSSIKVAQEFADRASTLAQQKFQNKELDRNLAAVKSARDKGLIDKKTAQEMSEDLFRGAAGEKRTAQESPTKNAAVQRAIDRAARSQDGSLRVASPQGSVELTSKNKVGGGQVLDVAIDPKISPVKQRSRFVCWAAGGTMMRSWQLRRPETVENVLDSLGGDWRVRFEADEGLKPADFRAFMAALHLVEEGLQRYTPQGLARLLGAAGPLLTIGDDGVEGNNVVHVRIVTRVFGDGTPNATQVVVADSASGTEVPMDFTVFARNLEASEPAATGLGIFHF